MKSHDVAMALRGAYLTLHRHANGCLLKYDFTADQFVCLTVLDENDRLTQQELALRTASSPQTIHTIIQVLEKRGLIIKKRNPANRRTFSISITQKGREVLKNLFAEIGKVNERMLTVFDKEETDMLFDFLNRISKKLH